MKYQDFSFYSKIISSSRAVKILFLSFTCEDIGVAMVTNMISQLQESFPLRKYKYYCLYFCFITLYPSFITFCDRHFAIGDHFNCTIWLFRKRNFKKSCVLCWNFISMYKINRTLHSRLGIRILSSARPCNILYFHSPNFGFHKQKNSSDSKFHQQKRHWFQIPLHGVRGQRPFITCSLVYPMMYKTSYLLQQPIFNFSFFNIKFL